MSIDFGRFFPTGVPNGRMFLRSDCLFHRLDTFHLRTPVIGEEETQMVPDLFSKYAYSEKVLTHTDYDYIYISPHLDDVPLSCSGTIVRQKAQGLNVLIATVFAGDPEPPFSPFVQAFHRAWQAAETTPYQVRKAEEREAMAILAI